MEEMIFPAHIRITEGHIKQIESCTKHAEKTAEYASSALKSVGLASTGYFAGLIHDGKMTAGFSEYITKSSNGEPVIKGKVKHTFAPVALLLTQYHGGNCESLEDIAVEILAYAVGAHHGLFDCIDENSRGGFYHRIHTDTDTSKEAICNFFKYCRNKEQTEALLQMAQIELTEKIKRCSDISANDEETDFYIGLLTRLVLSGVIEGDRRDTAEFMQDAKFPDDTEDMRPLWSSLLNNLEEYLGTKKITASIEMERKNISDQCKSAASQPCGLYRLNVPTGGGKTLSGLRFALAHAKEHNKKRIIYTAPLLSVLEQNASEFRKALKNDAVILEHHSNVIHEKDSDETDDYLLLTENYSCPVIITTMVQLLNTLFDGRSSCIRRFHALSDAIILIDEVQTIPLKMLVMFNLAVNFLSEICGTTIVLCSATQPCFEEIRYSLHTAEDIIPYDPKRWNIFKRTEIQYAGHYSLSEIPDFLRNLQKQYDSILLVCNTKSEAERIYRDISESAEGHCLYLSAGMCMEHRRKVVQTLLEETKKTARKREGISDERKDKLICISTQVIEAGVDISFGCVVRILAGWDNVIQSAGRGNRNGESVSPVPVYIIQCDDENLTNLSEIQNAKNAAIELLDAYEKNPEKFQCDLASENAIRYYYRQLYQAQPQIYMEMKPSPRKPSLFSLLSDNKTYQSGSSTIQKEWTPYCLSQAFAEAGRLFRVFDSDTEDVIVPYGNGADIITKLCSKEAIRDIKIRKKLLEEARSYTVSLYRNQIEDLREQLSLICDGHVLVLQNGYYDDAVGVSVQRITNQEVNSFCGTATLLSL